MIRNKGELIRIVRTPEGEILIDPTGKLNGRGAYLCRDPKCLAKAAKSGALARSLKVQVPEELLTGLAGKIASDGGIH